MIDYFALALTHGILALAFLRLLRRGVLDRDAETQPGEDHGAGQAAPHYSRRSHRGTLPRGGNHAGKGPAR